LTIRAPTPAKTPRRPSSAKMARRTLYVVFSIGAPVDPAGATALALTLPAPAPAPAPALGVSPTNTVAISTLSATCPPLADTAMARGADCWRDDDDDVDEEGAAAAAAAEAAENDAVAAGATTAEMCACTRVFTTSKGVVMNAAALPARVPDKNAAVNSRYRLLVEVITWDVAVVAVLVDVAAAAAVAADAEGVDDWLLLCAVQATNVFNVGERRSAW
jgi:hypothetical protein